MPTTLNNILLRLTAHPPMVSPKGSELTYAELDNNFILIYDWIKFLNQSGNIEPYDSGTAYTLTPPSYVSYDGNIWHYVNATPTAGITPGTDVAYWEQVSIGVLSHVQNTDEYLAIGTGHQVSAQEVYNHIHPIVKSVAQIQALAGSYVPGQDYIVTNPGLLTGQFLTGGGVMLTAMDNSTLSYAGIALLKNAAMAAFGNFDVIYDVANDWFTEVTHQTSKSTVRLDLGGFANCMSSFPFDDGVSNGSFVDNAEILDGLGGSAPGAIYLATIKRGASVTVPIDAAIGICEIQEFAVYTGAAATLSNDFTLKKYGTYINSSPNQIEDLIIHDYGTLDISGNSAFAICSVGEKSSLTVIDSTISNVNYGPGIVLTIDGQTLTGDSSGQDVTARNNNTLALSGFVAAADPLDLTDTEMCGIIPVNGSNTTIDDITAPANVVEYWDIEIIPISGLTLTFRDKTIGSGNIRLLGSTGTSAVVNGTKGDSIKFRYHAGSGEYRQKENNIYQ